MKFARLAAGVIAAASFSFAPIAFGQENASPHEGNAPTYSTPYNNTGGSVPSTFNSTERRGPAVHGSYEHVGPPERHAERRRNRKHIGEYPPDDRGDESAPYHAAEGR